MSHHLHWGWNFDVTMNRDFHLIILGWLQCVAISTVDLTTERRVPTMCGKIDLLNIARYRFQKKYEWAKIYDMHTLDRESGYVSCFFGWAELNFVSTQSKWYSLQHILCTLIWGQKRSKNINKTVPNDGTWCTSDTCFMSVSLLDFMVDWSGSWSCVRPKTWGNQIHYLVQCQWYFSNLEDPDMIPIWHAEKQTHQFLSTYIFVSGEAVVEWIPLQLHVIVVSKKQEIHLQDMPRNTSVLPGSADVAGVDYPISAWKGCNGCFSPELCDGTLLMMMMPMRNHSFQLCFLRTTV